VSSVVDVLTLVTRVSTERQAVQRKQRRRASTRRMWSLDDLSMPRAYMRGPRWRSMFNVREVPIADIDPQAAQYHRPGRKLLMFSLEADVHELVQEEIRPGVFAEWSDPYERLPL
jgi:hypothetical protein